MKKIILMVILSVSLVAVGVPSSTFAGEAELRIHPERIGPVIVYKGIDEKKVEQIRVAGPNDNDQRNSENNITDHNGKTTIEIIETLRAEISQLKIEIVKLQRLFNTGVSNRRNKTFYQLLNTYQKANDWDRLYMQERDKKRIGIK